MIPFWKKTGKHSKPQSAQKRRQNTKPAVPRTAQQSIPMQRMFEDGTCRVKANYYTRTIAYQDINYQLAQQEDKTAIFEEWCSFLNFFDSSIKFELSFVNMATDSTEVEITEEKINFAWFPYTEDGDEIAAYTQFITGLCDMAKDAKRVSSKPTETDNDKYAFRCFLLRLGFIGNEYKTARKILLRNLTGNSAFRYEK